MSNPTREAYDRIVLHTREGGDVHNALQTQSGEILMQAGVMPNGEAMVFFSRKYGNGGKPEVRTVMLADDGEQYVLRGNFTSPQPVEQVVDPNEPNWFKKSETSEERLARRRTDLERLILRKRDDLRKLENEILGYELAVLELDQPAEIAE